MDERRFEAGVIHKTGLLVDERRFEAGTVHKTALLVDERHFEAEIIATNKGYPQRKV